MSKATECLYEIENNPTLHGKLKEYIKTGDEAGIPKFMKKVLDDIQSEKRQVQLSAIKLKEALDYVQGRAKGGDFKSWEDALNNIVGMSYHIGSNRSANLSIESRALAILGASHAKMADAMHNYRVRKAGFDRSPKAQEELVKAFYGKSNDVDAKQYASIMGQVMEDLRVRYNAAGGNIAKLEDFKLPQVSDATLVGRVSFDEWFEFVKTKIDVDRIQEALGVDKVAPDQLKKSMKKVYDGIRTRGLSNKKPGGIKTNMRSQVAGRHQDHRFLHFRDAESWVAYNQKFGDGTPYSAITAHIDRMSREIAAMEVLGPHPEKNLSFLIDVAQNKTGRMDTGQKVYNMYRDIMGELEGVGNPKVASRMRDARNIMTFTKLGSAQISALSDSFFLGSAARLNDIPIVGVYKQFLKLLNPANHADRVFAGKLHLTMDYAVDSVAQFNRISTVSGNNASARAADMAMRVNGLAFWTHAGNQAFGMEFMARLGEMASQPFNSLSKKMQSALDRYGVTAADWGKLKNNKTLVHNGIKYLDPSQMDADLQAKIVGMVLSESKFAVPQPTARVRSFINQGHAAGTVAGEVFRTVGQFKSFPLTILINQLGRRWSQDAMLTRMTSIGSMITFTTVIGALAYNLKEIAKGRTPMDWDTGSFWANGFIQGGGAGLIGDMLFMDPSKRGSLVEFAAGPLVGELANLPVDFLLKPINELAKGEDDIMRKLAVRAVALGQRNIPAPLNLPFLRLATQRAVFDSINKQLDPDWYRKQRKLNKTYAERGQSNWSEPY